jgi:hypothetical protein
MNIRRMYHELILTSLVLNFFDSLLTATAIFSVGYFIVYFYRLNFLFAVITGGAFFIRSLVRKIRQNKILILENKYPNLRERLRTSYDYQDKTNTIINQLHTDIISMMKKVDVNAYLSSRDLFLKILIILIMLSSTLYLSSIGLDILDVTNIVINSQLFKRTSGFVKDIFDETRNEITNRPLLDDPRLITLGNKDLNISIDTYNTELDISEVSDPEKNDYGGHYPEEILGAAQKTYDEKIPEEHREVIKEYFKKINE